jgi:CBS domain-containing protein
MSVAHPAPRLHSAPANAAGKLVKEDAMKVSDVMTREVVTVAPQASLKEAAEILAQRRISGLPVVDQDGVVLGVVSEADILFKERPRPEDRGLLLRLFGHDDAPLREKSDAVSVGQAMTAPPITIDHFAPVSSAAERMLDAHVHRLPVVDVNGKLLGIVTRADLVRAFVRSDEEIERELREEVLIVDTDEAVHLTVENGVVQLSGTVGSKIDADLIPSIAERVPGVVKVEGELNWRWDPTHERSSSY